MEHQSDMGAYGENPNVQNSGNYITIIPVDYSRRGYPMQAEYQYNEFRSREEYYSVQSQKLQAEVNAHLYSVSQRLPHLSYSPLGRHSDWDKHDPHKPLQPDSKESNSSDSLEKSVMGSNLSSCSNQTGSSSIAAGSFSTTEPITSGGSSSSAISPPLPGSSGSTASSSTVSSNPVTCIYLMSRTAVMMEMSSEEVPSHVTAARFLNALLATEELGLSQPSTRSLAANVFALWMCSPLLEIQLKPHHCPWRFWANWQKLVHRYGHGSESRLNRDQPVLRLQRNVFFPKHLEEGIKDSRIQELLYEEARHNVVTGRYPLESAQAVMLGGLQARIQLGPYDPHRHTARFFRAQQDKYLPQHARSGRWAALLPAGRKGSPEARLLEHAQRPPAAPPRKLRHKYLAHTRTLPTYGAAFFQGQIEQPVRSLTSLLTHEDIPVLVAVNSNGVYVIDDTESTVLLGLLYEELSWDFGIPSDDSEDCLPYSRIQELLYEEARHNVVTGRYPLESAQAVMLGGLQARIQLGPYDPHRHTARFFRAQQDKYLPQHARSGRWAALLPAGRKGSPEARLLEHAQRPPAAPPRKLRHKYLAHTRTLPTYGAAFFQGQIEQPVRSLTSLLTHEDIPVLVAVNSNGVYVIDDTESTVLLGLLYEELSWDFGIPSDDSEDCLPCLFLQFMVVENGLRVSKILQVFSKQAMMMDTLIEHFAGEYRKRLGQETPSDHANYDYHSDSGSISLPPLSRPDSPQRRLANKLSRLALATHDGRGNLLGGAGDWNTDLNYPRPSWILPKH
uniref:FERM domain-containing protein 8 n=1 Tax=Heliothis virescens TaxID=7102 RepID=A0A2A4JXC4_HELVI